MRTCEKCKGGGYVNTTYRHGGLPPYDTTTISTAPCDACSGSGVTAAPRSEGPREIRLADAYGYTFSVAEWSSGPHAEKLWMECHGDCFLTLDAERQLYELLKLRAERGPPTQEVI